VRSAPVQPFLRRRDVLKAGLSAGFGLAICRPGLAGTQAEPSAARLKEGDLLVRVDDTTRTPLSPGDIAAGGRPTAAWPMDPIDRIVRSGLRFNELLLVRVDPDRLAADTRSRAGDGVIAYTMVCTHSGC